MPVQDRLVQVFDASDASDATGSAVSPGMHGSQNQAPSSASVASLSAHTQILPTANIKVIGVGGAGGNAVSHMIANDLGGVDFICANTDAQALSRAGASTMIQLGATGLGAGARPEVGEACAREADEQIRAALNGVQMLFITAGLGGGTGTGAAPVIAKIAKEMDILTVAVVTKPFEFEGTRRARAAQEGLSELEAHTDSLIVILNDRLLEVLGDDVTQDYAFAQANEVLRSAVAGIASVIQVPGHINVDFEDVKTIMERPGRAMMGTAQCSGPDRALKAAEHAIACPLLEGIDLSGASGLLVLISASRSTFKLAETRTIMTAVNRYAHPDAQIKMGTAFDDSLGEELRVTVIATGLTAQKQPAVVRMGMRQVAGTDMTGGQSSQVVHPFGLVAEAVPSSQRGGEAIGATGGQRAPSAGWGYSSPESKRQGSRNDSYPAVWRNGRIAATAKVDAMAAGGMEDLEIPAFLRKQAD